MRANLLLLVTDDQRADTIGNPQVIAPNISALVERGCRFDNAYIPGGFTGAVCMPSRGMLHTGRDLCGLQGNGETIPEGQVLLGEWLGKAGYRRFGTGKWHNGPPAFTRSFDSGERVFFGGMWDHWNVPTCRYDPLGNYDNEVNFVADFFHSSEVLRVHCDELRPGVHSTDLIGESAEDFLRGCDGEVPFFCSVAFLAPHDPRTMPREYLDLYQGRPLGLPDNFMPTYPVAYDGGGMRDEDLTPYPRTRERTLHELRAYYAMITHVDHRVGRIIGVLEERGLLEDTIVVLCGDNGLGLGCHAFLGKQNLYEPSIRVPLVLAGPGVPSGTRRDSPVFLYDLFPTLCGLLDLPVPDSVTGRSFLPCLGEGKFDRKVMYYCMMDRARGVRRDNLKLSVYLSPDGGFSTVLYDLAEDPEELYDLSDRRPGDLSSMMALLLAERDRNEDLSRPESRRYWGRFASEPELHRLGSGSEHPVEGQPRS